MSDLHQVLRDLEAQRQAALARYDHAIAGVRQLVEATGDGRAPTASRPRRLTPQHQASARGPQPGRKRQSAPVDWERGKKLWAEGKPVREIAAALGCADGAVYYQASAHHWGARKKNGLKGKGAGA